MKEFLLGVGIFLGLCVAIALLDWWHQKWAMKKAIEETNEYMRRYQQRKAPKG